eukprot:5912050-Prymnesium_polylepis.1
MQGFLYQLFKQKWCALTARAADQSTRGSLSVQHPRRAPRTTRQTSHYQPVRASAVPHRERYGKRLYYVYRAFDLLHVASLVTLILTLKNSS